MTTVDLLLHPVRLRVVHALSGGAALTTAQLGARMPEVSKVTVYRQVAALVDGGFLEVAGEQRVRGAVERRPAREIAASAPRFVFLRVGSRSADRETTKLPDGYAASLARTAEPRTSSIA